MFLGYNRVKVYIWKGANVMDRIEIIQKSKDESIYKKLSLFFGLVLLAVGLKDMEVMKMGLGLLFIFYFTYSKNIYLTKEGVIYTYKGFLFNRQEEVKFNDIEGITLINKMGQCTLFLIKEPMARKVVVDYEKTDEIIAFIKENTNIPLEVNP